MNSPAPKWYQNGFDPPMFFERQGPSSACWKYVGMSEEAEFRSGVSGEKAEFRKGSGGFGIGFDRMPVREAPQPPAIQGKDCRGCRLGNPPFGLKGKPKASTTTFSGFWSPELSYPRNAQESHRIGQRSGLCLPQKRGGVQPTRLSPDSSSSLRTRARHAFSQTGK